jgi:acyl-CoA-binding protein
MVMDMMILMRIMMVTLIKHVSPSGPYQPSDNMMLMFYSYYKQATLGPCHAPRPIGFWDSRGKAKWSASF